MTPLHVLLVDDDASERMLVELLLKDQAQACTFTGVADGHAALRFLEDAAVLPDLILLDLEMPGMDGFEVLAHLKAHPAWRLIPVAILTVNERDEDVQRAYDLHASGFLCKPVHPLRARQQMAALLTFWVGSTLPTRLAARRLQDLRRPD